MPSRCSISDVMLLFSELLDNGERVHASSLYETLAATKPFPAVILQAFIWLPRNVTPANGRYYMTWEFANFHSGAMRLLRKSRLWMCWALVVYLDSKIEKGSISTRKYQLPALP
jgi:hypothetical protein